MRIAIGSDHRGGDVVDAVTASLEAAGHTVLPVGRCDADSCDYPDKAFAVAAAVAGGDADLGVLACGSGNGVAIAANKVDGVRAGQADVPETAEMTRRHNDANVICLGADRITPETAVAIVDAFANADFEGGRHGRRVDKIRAIERGEASVAAE